MVHVDQIVASALLQIVQPAREGDPLLLEAILGNKCYAALLLSLQELDLVTFVHASEGMLAEVEAVLAHDLFPSLGQGKETHLYQRFVGSELRLELGRNDTGTGAGVVSDDARLKLVTSRVIEVHGFADCVLVDPSSPGDVAPPDDDLAEVMQRTVPPRQQVLDYLAAKLLPSDALVEQREPAGGC